MRPIYRHYFRTEDAAQEACAYLNRFAGGPGAVTKVASCGGCLVHIRVDIFVDSVLGRLLADLAEEDRAHRDAVLGHQTCSDGLPPSDADPETGIQYGEVA